MLKKIWYRFKFLLGRTHGKVGAVPEGITAGSPVVLSAQVAWIQLVDTLPFEIKRISLLFATFQRQNSCKVDISLYSNKNELLHFETVKCESLVDNAFYTLKLPDDFIYRGLLYLVICSPDATPTNCVALWAAPDLGAAGLRAVPRTTQDGSIITPAAQGPDAYQGVTLVFKVGRHSRTHALRSYPRLGGEAPMPHARLETLGVVGFRGDELQALSTMARSSLLKIQELSVEELDRATQCQALLLSPTFDIELGYSLARFARRKMLPLIMADIQKERVSQRTRNGWLRFADGLITCHSQPESRLPKADLDNGLNAALDIIMDAYRTRWQPKVSIVTILSGKAEQLRWVIESYFDQTYPGEIEIVYINDCFGDEAEAVVASEFARNRVRPHAPQLSYTILRNEQNLGNCASRNRGVSVATGDIVVIIDADCMLNQKFIAAHVDAHAGNDCEVVTGPHNIETHGAPPFEKLAELERTPLAVLEEADLQDPLFLDGFLNCITRNFSIKKPFVTEDLFDLDFSYSLAPDTGFGWEDVEMGYRLYKRGLGIKFTEDAFSVHISHSSSVAEAEKPKKSIRNFHKLFIKHPELSHVARRWAVRTLDLLNEWSATVDPAHNNNADLISLRKLFEDAPRLAAPALLMQRKLRVLTYRWHVPHQYELYKSGHDFFLAKGTGSPMCDDWEYGHRPLPLNANFIDLVNIRSSDYDLALLHFDENVLNYENTNGQLGPEWGAAFRYFVEELKLPKVAICHGTPQFHGQYTPGYNGADLMTVIEPARAALVDYERDIEIVCNSHQAQREWGFHKSRVIWHGFDPSEFLPATYSKGILSPLGPLVQSRPHYRGFYLYQQVFSPDFPKAFLPETLHVPNPDIDYVDNIFAIAKYKNYIDQIRQYSVYFNPTLRSPMPRARCEPMMCGVVTVNANNHDVDMFIKNGVNGFYSNDPEELREQLLYLMRHPDAVRKMGSEARKTAMNVFNHDRYLADWSKLLKTVV